MAVGQPAGRIHGLNCFWGLVGTETEAALQDLKKKFILSFSAMFSTSSSPVSAPFSVQLSSEITLSPSIPYMLLPTFQMELSLKTVYKCVSRGECKKNL